MSEHDLAYESAAVAPAPVARRRGLRRVGVAFLVLTLCLLIAGWVMAHQGYVVIDGVAADGLEAVGGGFLGLLIAALAVGLAAVMVVVAMLSVSAVLLVVFGLVLLVVGLALTPIWLPVAIMAAFLVWLLRR